jgi:hypothetical protein
LIGAVVGVVGVGLIVTLFLLSSGALTTNRTSFENPTLSADSVWVEVVTRSGSSQATVTLSWSSSEPVNVTLTPAQACSSLLGYCASGAPVFNWTLQTSGKATDSSASAPAYLLRVVNPSASDCRVSAVASVSYNPGSSLPDWAWFLIVAGGVILLAMGGIAIFLGLFLPRGVYQDPGRVMRGRPPPFEPPEEPGPDEPEP